MDAFRKKSTSVARKGSVPPTPTEDDAATASLARILCYVPRCVLQYYLKKKKIQMKPSCKQTEASLLFADVSGFTALNEKLALRGASGFEDVSRHLNAYFSQLLDTCTRHGGDVLKFAGDAVIVMFSTENDTLSKATRRSVQCALDLQKWNGIYQKEDLTLSCHIGISAGQLSCIHVGGVDGRWEFLVAGEPLKQLESAVDAGKSGDVVLSPQAWALVKASFLCTKLDSGDYLATATNGPALEAREAPPLPLDPIVEPALRGYLNRGVLARLDAGQTDWLGELRRVTVIFVNLKNLSFGKSGDHVQLHNALCTMQKVIFRQQGIIRQLLVDDKGTVLIAVFGVPPFSHEDDALRGTRAAMAMQTELYKLGFLSAIGVTTGNVYCGTVGSEYRKEYAVVGDIVNLSARLMKAAGSSGVLCCKNTYDLVGDTLIFQELPAIMVKGKSQPVNIYRPHPHLKKRVGNSGAILGREAEQAILEAKVRSASSSPVVVNTAATTTDTTVATRKWRMRVAQPSATTDLVPSSTSTLSSSSSTSSLSSSSSPSLSPSASPSSSSGSAVPTASVSPSLSSVAASSPALLRSRAQPPPLSASHGSDTITAEGLLIVEGKRGSGKSLLIDYLEALCEEDADVTLYTVISMPDHKEEFCVPWRMMILKLLQCEDSDRSTQKQQILSAVGALSDPKWSKLVALLNPMFPTLGFAESRTFKKLDASQAETEFKQLIVELLRSSSKLMPVILCFENSENFDKDSWLLLRYVCQLLTIPIVITSNPILFGHAFDHLPHVTPTTVSGRMVLGPLDRPVIEQCLCSALKVLAIESAVLDIIIEKSLGNPMFAVKLARAMVESNSCVIEAATLTLRSQEEAALCVPTDLVAVIQSQLDIMHPTAQLLVKITSVMEEGDDVATLDFMLGVFPIAEEKDRVPFYLDRLREAELIVYLREDKKSWKLASSLIQQATYNLLLVAQRREIHKSCCDYLEATRKTHAAKAISFHRRRSMLQLAKGSADVASVDIIQRAKQEENAKVARRLLDAAVPSTSSVSASPPPSDSPK